ncbi:unnamed protein product, partial [Oppiella nova]
MSSGCIDVEGNNIWYEKFGTGPHPLLLIPGAIGTGRTDFGPQIQGQNALNLKKYTLVAMEPLGWGRSRPPIRKYDNQIYNNDAYHGYKIMEALGYTNFSVMGWSDGAKTAIIMAALYPSRIRSCIVWGIVTYASEKDIKAVVVTKNIKFWGNDLIQNYESVYGEEWFGLWTRHMEFLEKIQELFPNGFVKNDLQKVRCPIFVMHGDQDPIVGVEHSHYVIKNISDSRLHRFPKGSHNLHFTFAKEFKQLVEDFLSDVDDGYSFKHKDIKAVVVTKNIKFWGNDLIQNYESVYGEEWFGLWTRHMEFLEKIQELFPNGFVKNDLQKVRCPIFVMHGDQDPIVGVEHSHYVIKNISDSRLHRFPKGSHNLHFTFAKEFKQLVEDFLSDVDDGALSSVAPGDTINMADGLYKGSVFTGTTSGKSGSPITLTGSRKAVLTGTQYGFWLKADWWVLKGFTVANSPKGVMLEGANHNVLDGLEVYNT